MLRSVLDWFDERTGLVTFIREFFAEKIPASAGWHQVFGSVALFLLVAQFLTGALLAFNYAAQPEAAYKSLTYIVTEVTGGRLMRGLHHWGASVTIVVVVLHMVQVLIWGAYKKPREMTWIVGIALLLLTLGFGLTGYLLPWNNRAYWATVVTLQISALPPGGDLALRLLGSQDGTVGVKTFSRFYALHVMILPAITAALAAFHLYLVRRHGITPHPGDENRPPQDFYPNQVFKDAAAIFICFGILFGMAALIDVPLGRVADPTDTSFVPRPEWYFLFLFQLLKFFEGSWEVVGAVVLPTLAILALAALPFLDRTQVKLARQRFMTISMVGLAGIGWAALTVAAWQSTPSPASQNAMIAGEWAEAPPTQLAGFAVFREFECEQCHNLSEGPPKPGPTLSLVADPVSAAKLARHVESRQVPAHLIPALHALAQELTPQRADALESAPEEALVGARIYFEKQCAQCHLVNGQGQSLGPPLNGVGRRRDADWLAGHFREPQKYVPDSMMPAYDLPPPQMDALVAYMLALPAAGG